MEAVADEVSISWRSRAWADLADYLFSFGEQ